MEHFSNKSGFGVKPIEAFKRRASYSTKKLKNKAVLDL